MIKNINSKLKKLLMMGAFALMTTATVTSCKNNNEPSKRTVSEVTPTDKEEKPTATVTVAPTNEPTATVTVAPTATPTPTPVVSNITTVTKPSDVEGYSEITSLSATDIKEGSMIQEYDKILNVNDFAESMNLTNLNSEDLAAALDSNETLKADPKNDLALALKEFDTNKIDVSKSLLYTNLPKLKVEEGNYNTDRAVVFDPFNCVIYINKNVVKTDEEKYDAIRLGLGYATVEAYVEVNGEKTLCSPSVLCYEEGGNIVERGEFAKNALAQIIANKASGKEAITSKDPNFADVIKFTFALNYADFENPYTYEKYLSTGYSEFAKLFGQYANPTDLLRAEKFYANDSKINNVETTDIKFVEAYNFIAPFVEQFLEDIHNSNSFGGDNWSELYSMRYYIGEVLLIDNQGYSIEKGEGYTASGDGIVVDEFTFESFRAALNLLVDKYDVQKTKVK